MNSKNDYEMLRSAKSMHWKAYSRLKAERISTIYETHPTDIHVKNVIIEALKECLKSGNVLDVGCGTGEITIPLHDEGFNMTGLDISKSMLQILERKKGGRNISIIEGDIFEIEDLGVDYDAVVCRYVFTHYQDFRCLLSKIGKHLRSGGLVVFDSLSKDAVEFASKIYGINPGEIYSKVYGPLASFSDLDLLEFCSRNNFTIKRRFPSAFFHRNPIFANVYSEIEVYDSALYEQTIKNDVRNFFKWFQDNVCTNLPSMLCGGVINVLQKI